MKKMVIFDLDGLLVDSERVYYEGWLQVFRNHQISFTDSEILTWNGSSWHQIAKIIERKVGNKERVRVLRREREEYVYEQLDKGLIPVKPFAKEVLTLANEEELLIGLASSTDSYRGKRFLTKLKLEKYFDFFVFGDEVENHKPDPEVYLKILEKAKMQPNQAFAIEDSLVGAGAATKAGLEVFLIPDQSFRKSFSVQEKSRLTLLEEAPTLETVCTFIKNNREIPNE